MISQHKENGESMMVYMQKLHNSKQPRDQNVEKLFGS